MGSSAGRIVDGRRCWSLGEEGRREAGEDGDEREDAAGLRHWTGLGGLLAGWLGWAARARERMEPVGGRERRTGEWRDRRD